MANFTFNSNLAISTDDGISLARAKTGVASSAKQLLDDEFAGSTTIDFAPLVASITDPLAFILKLSGDGATLNFDGIGLTTKAFKVFQAGITANVPGPSGVLDLEIVTQGAQQRVQFLAVGTV